MNIQERIERLAEINYANSMMKIGDDLRNERKIIVNFLKVMEVIELDENGGFHFIGEKLNDNKKIYLDSFENF
jgi:hypothetical protein